MDEVDKVDEVDEVDNTFELFDTHVHLTDDAFNKDLPAIISRAIEANVSRIVTIGLDETSSRQCRDLAHQYKLWFTAGIHPCESAKVTPESIDAITSLASDARCVAVGEIGLDYYWPDPPPPPQIRVFHKMLELAAMTGLPVVIHQRHSFDEVLKIVDGYELKGKGIFHCFGGSVEHVREVASRGFYVSFAGNVTYKKGRMEEAVRAVPMERLLIETDAPYLAPAPYRGKRNEPGYVKFTAIKIAEILQLTLEEIANITFKNALRVFRIEV